MKKHTKEKIKRLGEKRLKEYKKSNKTIKEIREIIHKLRVLRGI